MTGRAWIATRAGRVALLALVLAAALTGTSATAARPRTLRVGRESLHRCGHAWCGTLRVPLDYRLEHGPTIGISFRWYPATGGHPVGTVVPVEGGPGYPSIGSVAPDGYAEMYGPLLRSRNMLAVDNRGTGTSATIDCPELQRFDLSRSGSTATRRFERLVGRCGRALNHRWRAPAGAFIHASDLFTSALAARDLARVIGALGLRRVDLYGDSYGSFFAQVFAARYPRLIRTVTLDSTYTVEGRGYAPWYASTLHAMPADFDEACRRSVACARDEPIPAWRRISQLAARLRRAPISGFVSGPFGGRVRMDAVGLVDLVSDAAQDPHIYASLDAAARALLLAHNPAPLLRLYAGRLISDENYQGMARDYSTGDYFAVACLDYPQLFSMHAAPSRRRRQLEARIRAYPATGFAPFTTLEWLDQDQYTEATTGCLDWPSPQVATPPVGPRGLRLPSHVPVLILGGEFDTWTPHAGLAKVRRQLGGHERTVIMANSTHVVAVESSGCAVSVLRAFIRRPARLDRIDTSCAARVPPIRAIGDYPAKTAQVLRSASSSGSVAASGRSGGKNVY
jgi:pimeloyl-ACP methyl ester carboxylesterase